MSDLVCMLGGDNVTGAGNQQERPASMALVRVLTPDYVTGFVDGEGCFSVSIHPHPSAARGWLVHPVFQVYQHRDNAEILEAMRSCFGCGTVTSKGPKSSVMTFSVFAKRDLLERVIPFFDQHPLISGKHRDYLRFREVVVRMRRKEHLNRDGFESVVRIAFGMNAHGKQRKYRLDEVLAGIPRDCTPDIRNQRRKIQSEPRGDTGSWAEMTQPLEVLRGRKE